MWGVKNWNIHVVLQFAKINKKTKNSWKKLEKQEEKKSNIKRNFKFKKESY
jgi:hypothetical protein